MKVTCKACGKVAEAFKFFSQGPVCQSCTLKATAILQVYVIDGRTYVESLKKEISVVGNAGAAATAPQAEAKR